MRITKSPSELCAVTVRRGVAGTGKVVGVPGALPEPDPVPAVPLTTGWADALVAAGAEVLGARVGGVLAGGVTPRLWLELLVECEQPAIAASIASAIVARPRTPSAITGSACQAGRMPSRDGTRRTDRVDELDARLLRELDESPRVGVLELSRRLGVARATVQARMDRLVERGVIASFAPTLDPVALGYGVTAFATLEIRQGRGQIVLAHLREIPEVLEVHTITGPGDMLCRLVARSNDDLQQVLDRVTEFPEIVRTSTVIALSNPVPHRVLPLVR
jgi:DNA-binding Lrp family transcriptional regulator